MKIILSPAKKMKVDTDSIDTMSSPVFLEKAEEILMFRIVILTRRYP